MTGRAPTPSGAGEPRTAMLLVEVLTEELPPRALPALGIAFAEGLGAQLAKRAYLSPSSTLRPYATPRRLAVAINDVRSIAPDTEVVEKLMPAKVAWDADGAPTAALHKKLAAIGHPELARHRDEDGNGPGRIDVASDGKAEYARVRTLAPGLPLAAGLGDALGAVLEQLPIPKLMSYPRRGGYYNDVKFVRPAHFLVALHGADIVPISALGLAAGRRTSGHRFLGHASIDIASAEAWAPMLEAEGKVLPDFALRRAEIVRQLELAAAGDRVVMPDALLDEVTALVEWPAVLAGSFDPEFLGIPQECLLLTMQQNQRYFALADAAGRLTHRFLLVSNIATAHPRAIVEGNERVLRARLADARFFFDQDRKLPLASRVERLRGVVYHHNLGSQAERVARLRFLAREIAARIGADAEQADRAALLAKADLVTDMVGEFPELQGTMGRHYALHDGEPPVVADAIAQHYWPRYSGDALPEAPLAQAVALADKLEALTGLFGAGAQPTGDKDPYGLRRAAVGVLRILIERSLALPLPELLDLARQAFDAVPTWTPATDALADFIFERLRTHLREQGYTANQIEAVLVQRPPRIDTIPARLAAVKAFETLPEAQALSAANKRIVNILRKSGGEAAPGVDEGRLRDGAERDLWRAFRHIAPAVDAHCANGDYTAALVMLATVKPAVDRFFDDVMVMTDDPALRANRLALLRDAARAMNRVADISRLAA